MLKRIIKILNLSVFVGVFIYGNLIAQNGIEGVYKLAPYPLKPVPAASSLDKVKVVEIFSISCVHCYNFSKSEQDFVEQFGDKIEFITMDIGWMGDNLARFNHLAEEYNKGLLARLFLFRAFHDAGVRDLDNPKTLKIIAEQLGFPESYNEDLKDSEITTKIVNTSSIISRFRISSTPSFIIEDSIIVGGNDPENLANVVNSLLKNPIEYVR